MSKAAKPIPDHHLFLAMVLLCMKSFMALALSQVFRDVTGRPVIRYDRPKTSMHCTPLPPPVPVWLVLQYPWQQPRQWWEGGAGGWGLDGQAPVWQLAGPRFELQSVFFVTVGSLAASLCV